jgi:hypothetical protein
MASSALGELRRAAAAAAVRIQSRADGGALTRKASAAFSNSGAAPSQSGFRRMSSSEGAHSLFAFFISLSASSSFATAAMAAHVEQQGPRQGLKGSD